MQVNAVTANNGSVNATNRAELSAEDFWQIMLAYLQMQDPFQTADMNAMMEQFVTMQAAREMARLSDALQRVQALLLLGRVVSGTWEGEAVSGTVVGVSLSGSPTIRVKVGDQTYTLPTSAISEVALESSQVLSTQA